jgi:hypothetical protein
MEEKLNNYSIYLVDSPGNLYFELQTMKKKWLPTPLPKRKYESRSISCTYCLIGGISFFIVDSQNEFKKDSGYMNFIDSRPRWYEKIIIPPRIMYKERLPKEDDWISKPIYTNTRVGGMCLSFKNPIPIIDIIQNIYEYLTK